MCDVSLIHPANTVRRTTNPNVLVELGYAVAKLSSERIVLVLNTAFGEPEELPFDLKMNRVLTYQMQESDQNRAIVRKALERSLEDALRTIFAQIDKRLDVTQEERQRLRTLLSQEIAYNIQYLSDIHTSVQREQTKYEETFRQDSSGGSHSEGNPLSALKQFHPNALTWVAWESQLRLAPTVLSKEELDAVFAFYGKLKGVAAAQEDFLRLLHSKSDSPMRLVILGNNLEEVMKRIEPILNSYPKLLS